jgi:hypothetical protein
MVNTSRNVERYRIVHFYRTVYQVFVMKDRPMIEQNDTLSVIAIMLRYDFALSHNAFILSRIVITSNS